MRQWKSLGLGLTFGIAFLVAVCGDDETDLQQQDDVVSSRSYQGHENDVDTTNFVNVYPEAVGTRLDDCQTCHTGGTFTYVDSDRTTSKNPCDYCHLVIHGADDFQEPLPELYADTLNSYGQAYAAAGQDRDALRAIADADSDNDGYSNADEIAEFRYPGDENSQPGQTPAPMRTFTRTQLEALDVHTQFLLANATRQTFDEYATYTGVTIRDLLIAAGVDPDDENIEGITAIAPDGYLKDIDGESINQVYPQAVFYGGLDTATLGTSCGFVEYPPDMSDDVTTGAPIPGELRLMLAYERDGVQLDTASLDPVLGKINGEGPYRLVVPQTEPGQPDRGSSSTVTGCDDGYEFDETLDHNAGDMVRGVIAIRVNPLPEGYEDFDYHNGGWAYVEDALVIVYGYGVTEE